MINNIPKPWTCFCLQVNMKVKILETKPMGFLKVNLCQFNINMYTLQVYLHTGLCPWTKHQLGRPICSTRIILGRQIHLGYTWVPKLGGGASCNETINLYFSVWLFGDFYFLNESWQECLHSDTIRLCTWPKEMSKSAMVVYLPLWKISKSVGMITPNIWEKSNSCFSHHQPVNVWNQVPQKMVPERWFKFPMDISDVQKGSMLRLGFNHDIWTYCLIFPTYFYIIYIYTYTIYMSILPRTPSWNHFWHSTFSSTHPPFANSANSGGLAPGIARHSQ